MLPTPAEYKLAFELAEENFTSRKISPLLVNGRLWMSTHGYACVFKGIENNRAVAVKCFIKPVNERRERYRIVAEYLSRRHEPYWVQFEYLPEEFFVDSRAGKNRYDVVLMPWIEGQTLGEYVACACQRNDSHTLQQVAQKFDQLGAWLLQQEFAHGDLKHDNIIVRPDGSLMLIDYDGMFVPDLAGREALENGGSGYQHPERNSRHFDRHLDDFSILVISLSLHALAAQPELYTHKNTDNLLLQQTDFIYPYSSDMFKRLFALNNPEVNRRLVLIFFGLAAKTLHIPMLPALLHKAQNPPIFLIPYLKGTKWGFCTPDKRIVIPCKYDHASRFSEGLANVKKNGKFGFVDKSGTLVVPCEYDWADEFSEGLATVKKNGKYGFVDKSGTLVVPCKYDDANRFREGLATVKKNGKYGFVDKSGTLVVPCKYDSAYDFSEGLATVKKNGKYGFVDKSGTLVVPCEYDDAWSFSEGLAKVKKNGEYGFVDKSGTLVIPCKYDYACSFSEGLAKVKKNGKFGFVDKSGTLVIPCEYDSADDFREGLARVIKNGKFGFVDKSGTLVIPCEYDWADYFREGLANVKKNGKEGFVDKSGTLVIPCEYDDADDFREGLAEVKKNGRSFYINPEGVEYQEDDDLPF